MNTQNKTYKALMVTVETHHKVAVEAKKKSLTIDEFIKILLKK